MTTAPAPTTVSSPIVTPGHTIAPAPSQTLSPIAIGRAYSHPSRRAAGSIGCGAVTSWTFVAIWQSAPIAMLATSSMTQPKFTNVPASIAIGEPYSHWNGGRMTTPSPTSPSRSRRSRSRSPCSACGLPL